MWDRNNDAESLENCDVKETFILHKAFIEIVTPSDFDALQTVGTKKSLIGLVYVELIINPITIIYISYNYIAI